MTKKLSGTISCIIIIVLIFSFFSLNFSMSVLDGAEREFKDALNGLPFKPFFTVSLSIGSYSKSLSVISKCINNPLTYLLMDSKEINPQQVFNECLSKQKIVLPKQPNLEKCNIITSADAKKLEKSPYIKMAFVKSQLIDGEFKLKYKNVLVPIFHCPPGFLKDLGMHLKYGSYFTNYLNSDSIIITDNLSKEIFGDINPVGKSVQVVEINSNRSMQHSRRLNAPKVDYKIIGVLAPMSKNQEITFNAFSGAFAPLSENYSVTTSSTSKYAKLMAVMTNTLYVIPEEGESANALKLLKRFMATKGDGSTIKPVIDSTYKNLSNVLSVKGREEKVKYILYVVLFMMFISIFTSISFIMLEITHKKRTIYIKRAIGEDRNMLMKEYLNHYILLSFVALGSSLLILFLLFPFLKNLNVSGSIFNPNVPFSEPLAPHPLYIGVYTLSTGVISAFLISMIAVWFSLKKMIRKAPAAGIKDKKYGYKTNSINSDKCVLIIIIAVSIIGILLLSSLRTYTIRNIELSKNEVQPDIIRIRPTTSNAATVLERTEGSAQYTYDDYILVKKFIGNNGKVGFRGALPVKTQVVCTDSPNESIVARISDATSEFPSLYGFSISQGRFIRDNDYKKPICAVGADIADKLKVHLGDSLLIGVKEYRIIGILNSENPLVDNTIFVPCSSVEYPKIPYSISSGINGKGIFLVKANNHKESILLAQKVLQFLNKRHSDKTPGSIDDVTADVKNMVNIYTSLYTLLSVFIFLALLASFLSLSALLFIEVIRRTREIGIKKAIGATRREIIKEFTLNGLKTTIIALVIGIPIGILIALFTEKLKQWNYYIPINILILVIAISIALGFVFSFLPALFASYVKPVDAIKSE